MVQNQAQRQGFAPLAARPRRSKANFAGVRLWQTPRFHRLLLLFPQIFCYAKSLREPCHRPTGLFSLRRADLSTGNSRANRLLAQTPPPSNPCHIRVTQNGADQSRLRFPWRRDRDYLRLFQQTKRQGFFERLDGFAAVSVRSREPTAEKTSLHPQTTRRLWFKPCAPKKDEVKSPRLFLAQRQGFEPW